MQEFTTVLWGHCLLWPSSSDGLQNLLNGMLAPEAASKLSLPARCARCCWIRPRTSCWLRTPLYQNLQPLHSSLNRSYWACSSSHVQGLPSDASSDAFRNASAKPRPATAQEKKHSVFACVMPSAVKRFHIACQVQITSSSCPQSMT